MHVNISTGKYLEVSLYFGSTFMKKCKPSVPFCLIHFHCSIHKKELKMKAVLLQRKKKNKVHVHFPFLIITQP